MTASKRIALLVGLALVGGVTQSAETNPRAGIDFYLQSFGRVAPESIPDVYQVFERVRASADHSSMVTAQLVVVGDTRQALAFTLSDGTIVLSSKAIALMRDSATADEARARMAFVLGHELAHLAGNDFWDSQISQALTATSRIRFGDSGPNNHPAATVELRSLAGSSAEQQKKELKADDHGFLYAALAGFEVDSLLESSSGADDFLSYWNEQVGRRNDPSYPRAQERSGLLRLRLAELRGALNYYTYGVRLMHFGRYREATEFFREFQQHYPSPELFNNLGYCYLQLAMSRLDPEYAYRYWLPMLSELDSPLSRLSVRSADRDGSDRSSRMSAPARENLLTAARYFEQAVDKDERYAPGHINLAIAQLLLGMRVSATDAISENHLLRAKLAIGAALNLQANDAATRMLGAIIDYELQAADRSESGQRLRTASFAGFDANDPTYLYNLARLSGDDPVRAKRYWQRLIAQFDTLPKKLQALICHRQKMQDGNEIPAVDCGALASLSLNNANPPWPLPAKLSRDLLQQPISQAELQQHAWQPVTLDVGAIYGGARDSILVIDDIVTLIVMKPANASSDMLARCCSQPLERIMVKHNGAPAVLWHYGRWIALVRNSRVEEVWVAN